MRRMFLITGAALVALIPSVVVGSASARTGGNGGGAGLFDGAPPTGSYPKMTLLPDSVIGKDHSGRMAFGVAGMPDASFTVTKSVDDGQPTELSGTTDFMPSDSEMGGVLGLSRCSKPQCGGSGGSGGPGGVASTQIDASASTVVTWDVTFDEPVPAGVLGFSLGASGASQVVVAGTKDDSSAISGAELNGVPFNLCTAADAPPMCTGTSAPHPSAGYSAGDLKVSGAGGANDGAAVFFRPEVVVKTLTFTFSDPTEVTGAPVFRLWIAALASTLTVHGTLPGVTNCTVRIDPTTGNYVCTPPLPSSGLGADGAFTYTPTDPGSWQLTGTPGQNALKGSALFSEEDPWVDSVGLHFTHRIRVVPGVYALHSILRPLEGCRCEPILYATWSGSGSSALTGVRATRTSTGYQFPIVGADGAFTFTPTADEDGYFSITSFCGGQGECQAGNYPINSSDTGDVFDLPFATCSDCSYGGGIQAESVTPPVDMFAFEGIDLRANSVEIDLNLRTEVLPGFTG